MKTIEIAKVSHNQFETTDGVKYEVPKDMQDAMRLLLILPQRLKQSAAGLVIDPNDTIAVLTQAQICRLYQQARDLHGFHVIKTEDVNKSYADRTYDWVKGLEEVKDPANQAHSSIFADLDILDMDEDASNYFLWDDRLFFVSHNYRYKEPCTTYGWTLDKYTDNNLDAEIFAFTTHEDGLSSSDICHFRYWFYLLTKWNKDGKWSAAKDYRETGKV